MTVSSPSVVPSSSSSCYSSSASSCLPTSLEALSPTPMSPLPGLSVETPIPTQATAVVAAPSLSPFMAPSVRHTVRQRGSSQPSLVRLENRYSALLSVSATTSSASVTAPAAAALSQFPPLTATKARWADIELLSEDEDMCPVSSASSFSASTHKQKPQHKPQKNRIIYSISPHSVCLVSVSCVEVRHVLYTRHRPMKRITCTAGHTCNAAFA
eukprot:GHVQ01038989.1.p1 GENE.GHVQ01038989.1~~GHVQ01038989.1.p1  ORF type:complete len:213 (-),score=54.75 GHVQ01038989.1:1837-2475(-)